MAVAQAQLAEPSARPYTVAPAPVALRWCAGIVVGVLAYWVTALPFLNTPVQYVDDPELQTHIVRPGSAIDYRTEGWGTTHFGLHDVSGIGAGGIGAGGIEDFTQFEGPRIALWGDSFVEGFFVDDRDKPAQQVTRIWAESGRPPILTVGIARSGRTVADYYTLMPRYERLAEFRAHYILLHRMDDTVPDARSGFVMEPQPELLDRHKTPPHGRVRELVADLQLGPFVRLYSRTLGDAGLGGRTLRLRPGPVPAARARSTRDFLLDVSGAPPVDAWRFLVRSLRDRTERPVVFVYSPEVPWLDRGQVRFDDPERDFVEPFAQVCREEGIGFLDVTEANRQLYRGRGLLPRGFNNGLAGTGHVNVAGIQVFAAAICRDLQEKLDAVHSD